MQQAGEKLTDFLRELQQLALMANPDESQDIRDHLVLRVFLQGIHHSLGKLELRKTFGDKDMNIANALERALHLEAVTRIDKEENTPRLLTLPSCFGFCDRSVVVVVVVV